MKSNILVVDDRPVACQSRSEILRRERHEVNSAPNGVRYWRWGGPVLGRSR